MTYIGSYWGLWTSFPRIRHLQSCYLDSYRLGQRRSDNWIWLYTNKTSYFKCWSRCKWHSNKGDWLFPRSWQASLWTDACHQMLLHYLIPCKMISIRSQIASHLCNSGWGPFLTNHGSLNLTTWSGADLTINYEFMCNRWIGLIIRVDVSNAVRHEIAIYTMINLCGQDLQT